MKYAIVVFKSKTQVFEFIEEMRANGASATTSATPSQAKIGCGISARIDVIYLPVARRIIASGRYGGFYGIYRVNKIGSRMETVKIV